MIKSALVSFAVFVTLGFTATSAPSRWTRVTSPRTDESKHYTAAVVIQTDVHTDEKEAYSYDVIAGAMQIMNASPEAVTSKLMHAWAIQRTSGTGVVIVVQSLEENFCMNFVDAMAKAFVKKKSREWIEDSFVKAIIPEIRVLNAERNAIGEISTNLANMAATGADTGMVSTLRHELDSRQRAYDIRIARLKERDESIARYDRVKIVRRAMLIPSNTEVEEGQQSLPPVSGTRGTPAAYAPAAPRIPER